MGTSEREDDAMFRYQLIAPLLDPDLQRGECGPRYWNWLSRCARK